MALTAVRKTLTTLNPSALRALTSTDRQLSAACALPEPSSFTFSSDDPNHSKPATTSNIDDSIYIKGPTKKTPSLSSSESSVTMPMSFMAGSIVGKRFYKKVTTREADDGNGWSVMLDYRTLKTASKGNLKCPTLALAKAIAAEWEYQQKEWTLQPFICANYMRRVTRILRGTMLHLGIGKTHIVSWGDEHRLSTRYVGRSSKAPIVDVVLEAGSKRPHDFSLASPPRPSITLASIHVELEESYKESLNALKATEKRSIIENAQLKDERRYQ
ncbi:hypothetical protein Pfo_019733 [Paulownia fortunei]|nr:hypothetical protein Pfo_019733 [Paulownia fortunei]